MKRSANYFSLPERNIHRQLEDVVGCKWSSAVVAAIARGVRRPGALERYIPGISKKVLNERLRKLLAYGLIERTEFRGEAVPHVEYRLSPAGRKLGAVLTRLRAVQRELERRAGRSAGGKPTAGRRSAVTPVTGARATAQGRPTLR